jgi:alpha-mannosidase
VGGESFFRVDGASVIIQAVKMAEDGKGLVIRLREIAGKDGEAHLGSPLFKGQALSAWLTDLAEKNETAVRIGEDGVAVPLKAYGIQAVRVVKAR